MLHILDTILVHCILHVLGTILMHCLIWALCLYIAIKDNCVVGSFCVLTFEVGELLIFCVLVFIDLFTDWGKSPPQWL